MDPIEPHCLAYIASSSENQCQFLVTGQSKMLFFAFNHLIVAADGDLLTSNR